MTKRGLCLWARWGPQTEVVSVFLDSGRQLTMEAVCSGVLIDGSDVAVWDGVSDRIKQTKVERKWRDLADGFRG